MVNLGKMNKDQLLDVINSHMQQLTDIVDYDKANNIDENVAARAIVLSCYHGGSRLGSH